MNREPTDETITGSVIAERITQWFERGILAVVQLFLMIVIVLALWELWVLLWLGITTKLPEISSLADMQKLALGAFGGVLLVLIGLELLETVRAYVHDHRVRLEIVLVVAVIALGRHIVQLDIEHLSGASLLGIAALVAALMAGYFVVRRFSEPDREVTASANLGAANSVRSPSV